MKTTIEISDDLFLRIQRLARKEKTTFRALTETGLRIVLNNKASDNTGFKWKPATFRGGELSEEFKNATWQEILNESYKGRGT